MENNEEKVVQIDNSKEPVVQIENNEQFEQVELKKQEVRTDSYFDGSLIELIGWKILSFLITIVTLGIAAPWGQCMLYAYEIKHTVYNGKRLKFEGTGGDLFVNIFKWVLLSIITFGIYTIVIPVKKTKWVISNIHFEDEEFTSDVSFFDGKTIQLIGVNLLCNILNIVTLGLLYPFTVCYKLRWINKHTIINRKRLAFNGKAIQLFGKYILWNFLTVITFRIYGLCLPIKMLKWQSKHTHIKVVGEQDFKDNSYLFAIPIALIAIVLVVSLFIPLVSSNIEDFNIETFFEDLFDEGISFDSPGGAMAGDITSSNNGLVSSGNKNTSSGISSVGKKEKYPTASQIEGMFWISELVDRYKVNGRYDESRTQEAAGGACDFYNANGKIKYENEFTMNYNSSTGYANYTSGNKTAEAYFTFNESYGEKRIKVKMTIFNKTTGKETTFEGSKSFELYWQ